MVGDADVADAAAQRPQQALAVLLDGERGQERLRPRIDGLILELGGSRATFLPAVWEQLPDAQQFVRQLKLKAGLGVDFWSPQMRVLRYRTESFGETEIEPVT